MIQEKQENHLQRIKEKVRTPEGVPRLFDLITVQNERIKLAFYAALGNTVVAKDLDQVDCILCLLFNGSTSLPLILFLSHRIVVQQLTMLVDVNGIESRLLAGINPSLFDDLRNLQMTVNLRGGISIGRWCVKRAGLLIGLISFSFFIFIACKRLAC